MNTPSKPVDAKKLADAKPADEKSVQPPEQPGPDLQGEGNYEASRRYRRSIGRFIEEGKVEAAAADAATASADERRELERAERAGREHAKGEDDEFVMDEVDHMKVGEVDGRLKR